MNDEDNCKFILLINEEKFIEHDARVAAITVNPFEIICRKIGGLMIEQHDLYHHQSSGPGPNHAIDIGAVNTLVNKLNRELNLLMTFVQSGDSDILLHKLAKGGDEPDDI